jgi:inhibin beta
MQNSKHVKENEATRPFIVVQMESNVIKRTRRRAIDCSKADKRQCCKETFFVSFKALGWQDWIFAPLDGYYANYCRGECGSGINRSPDSFVNLHSQVIHEARKYSKLNGNQLCCAPIKFSPMSLIYLGPDNRIIKRNLPKMVVEECGCP